MGFNCFNYNYWFYYNENDGKGGVLIKGQHKFLFHYLIFISFVIFLIVVLDAPAIVDKETMIKLEEIRNKTAMFTGWAGAVAFPLSIIEMMFILMTAKAVGWVYTILFIPFFVVLMYLLFPMLIRIVHIGVDFIGRILSSLAGAGIWGVVGIAILTFITGGVLLTIARPIFAYLFFTPLAEEYCPGQKPPIIKFEVGNHTVPYCGKFSDKLIVINDNPDICNATTYVIGTGRNHRVIILPTEESKGRIKEIGRWWHTTYPINPGEILTFNVTFDTGAGIGYLPPWCLPKGNYTHEFNAFDKTILDETGTKLESKTLLYYTIV